MKAFGESFEVRLIYSVPSDYAFSSHVALKIEVHMYLYGFMMPFYEPGQL